MALSFTASFCYPGIPDHPPGQWCIEYTDELDVVHHDHVTTSDLFPILPLSVAEPITAQLVVVQAEINATATTLATEQTVYQDTATEVAAEIAGLA